MTPEELKKAIQELDYNPLEWDSLILAKRVKIIVETLNELISKWDTNVFIAQYDKTKFSEITQAIEQGKVVLAIRNNLTYCLSSSSSSVYRFTCVLVDSSDANPICKRLLLKSSNEWFDGNTEVEGTNNKVTSITDQSTDAQYPSAKAVYNALRSPGSVFVARRDITTYEEVTQALSDGRAVFAMGSDSKLYMFLVKLSSNQAYRFVTCYPGSEPELQYLQVNPNNDWTVSKTSLAKA